MKLWIVLALAGLASLALASELPIQSKSFIAVDAESGAVLFQKDAHVRRPPASCTKIMTALLLLENGGLDEVVKVQEDQTLPGESSMGLLPGEQIKVWDLLYAILLRSANDACVIAAVHVSGTVDKFVELMNRRAKELGANDTNFVNPHGLHDPQHFTTAYDLALIAEEAMKSPTFREIVGTYKHKIDRSLNKDDLWMVNHDKMLAKGTIVDGIKTGYTIPAGKCFVGSAAGPTFRVITVVLDSKDWQVDTQSLVKSSFDRFERREILPSRHECGRAEVRGGTMDRVAAITAEPLMELLPKSGAGEPQIEVTVKPVQAPVAAGDNVGVLRLERNGKLIREVPLVASASVPAVEAAASAVGWQFWVVSCVIGMAALRWLRRGHASA